MFREISFCTALFRERLDRDSIFRENVYRSSIFRANLSATITQKSFFLNVTFVVGGQAVSPWEGEVWS
jgi:hypothetical protein